MSHPVRELRGPGPVGFHFPDCNWLGDRDGSESVVSQTRKAVQRTVASNFRTHLYGVFGGRPWVIWLACIGDLPKSLFEIAKRHWEAMVIEGSGEPPKEGPPSGAEIVGTQTCCPRGTTVATDRCAAPSLNGEEFARPCEEDRQADQEGD